MKFTISYIALLLLPIVNIAQYSKAPIAYTSKDSTTSLTIYDLKLSNLNYRSMLYWYDTSKQIDSLYRVEKIGEHSVRTIEGNTNTAGTRDSRTGDAVCVKIRPLTKSIHITRWGK